MGKRTFKNKRLNVEKLVRYGFAKDGDSYFLVVPILDNQFQMHIQVASDGSLQVKTIETSENEEYVLHLTDAVGTFVGSVRMEYEQVLQDIANRCYENDIYKSKQTLEVIEYVREKYGDELEFLWQKFPEDAILRRKDSKKWYAVLMIISKSKLRMDDEGLVEVVDLHAEQAKLEKLVDNKNIFEGYHMNKKHWLTVCLDGRLTPRGFFS